jgi:hypothetical protein
VAVVLLQAKPHLRLWIRTTLDRQNGFSPVPVSESLAVYDDLIRKIGEELEKRSAVN